MDQLKPKLLGLTSEYHEIHDGITLNNTNLEELKLRIQEAIIVKQLAAAAKAAQDASTAAQALADARKAIQTQIDALNALIDERNAAFEKALTSKTQHVLHNLQTVIPNTVDGINLLQGEHISQATRDMVEGIDKDINTFKSNVDFERIATPFKARHETEIAGIQTQIGALTGTMSGVDITAMQSALASNPPPLSTTRVDFIRDADAFIGTLNTELGKLDTAKSDVETAIANDKDKDIAVKRDIEVLLIDAKKVDDSVKPFVDKLAKAEKIEVTSPSLKANLGAILGNAIITLKPFGIQVAEINDGFEQMKQTMNASYKSSNNYIALEKTIDGLNELYNAEQLKYDKLNAKYTSYTPAAPTPPSTLQTSTGAPRRPASARAAAAATTTTSQRRSTSADAVAAAAGGPRQAFTDAQFKPIPYTPSQDEEDYFIGAADVKSKPVTPLAPIIGERRNFLYISHNTEPKTAYLVVVKKPRLDESQGGGGGNKNYHIQKGGAPPPDVLPEGSEIFSIGTDSPNILDVMVSFIPPSELLQVRQDGTIEHPFISNIRSSGRRPKGDLNELYNKIQRELITEENQNPITIGLRAVYYQNIIKLIRLLDYNLRHEGISYEDMYEKVRKFMDYTYGTFGVLDALYKDTFHQGSLAPPPLPPISPPGSPRLSPRDPLKKIDSALKTKGRDAKKAIKKIVGWTSSTENTNFNMLTKMFSKECTHTGPPNTPNTFLNDDKKLGSSPYSYHKFRLNWIILLAFHSYYNKKSTLETVGKLIASLYNAFLGWLAISLYKDTFTRLFNETLPIDPTTKYSEIFNKQLNASLNSENSSYKDVYTLVQNINNKMCELQDDMIPAIDVEHLDEYDDEMNDPEYVPDENESDDSYGNTSPRRRAAGAELRLLSPSGVELGQRRRGQPVQTTSFRRGPKTPDELLQSERLPPPPGDPNPNPYRVDYSGSEGSDSDVEITELPKVPPLPLPKGKSLSAPLSERRIATLGYLKGIGVSGLGGISGGPARPSSSPSSSQLGSVSERLGAVSQFHKDANRDVEMTPGALPLAVIKQQSSQPTVITTGPRKQLSAGLSYKPPAAPASTPAAPASTPAPPSEQPIEGTIARRQQKSFKKRELKLPPSGSGGNNKKRTRKHKKHTSISASRRPTRRRRIPPTKGQKYTRKRPRT